MIKSKYRIKERVDSNGKSTYIPQYRLFGLFWTSWEGYPCGPVTFDDFKACKKWVCYEPDVKRKIHEVFCDNQEVRG